MSRALRRMPPHGLALLAVFAGAPGFASAQEGDPASTPVFAQGAPYRLRLDQLDGTIELRDHRGTLRDRWILGAASSPGQPPLAAIPPRRPLVVELVNANPLLYTYQVSAGVVARGGIKSCTDIGGRFAATGFLTSLMAVSGQVSAPPPPPDPSLFPPAPPPPATRGEAELTPSFLAAAAEQLRPSVEAYLATTSLLGATPQALSDSLAAAAELGESLPLDSLLSRLQRWVAQQLPGLRTASQTPAAVRSYLASKLPPIGELRGLVTSIERAGISTNDNPAGELLAMSKQVEAAERDLIASTRRLQGLLHRLEQARLGTRQTFALDGSPDYRRVAVEIQATSDYPEALRLRAGRQEVFTQPVTSVLCEISIGVAFMDRGPAYAADNGVLVDRDASQERTAPNFMVHAALSRLPWVGVLAGLGFGSQSRPDFYLGASLRLLNPILLNAGVVWQRIDRPPPGLALGDPVPDPSVLSDPRRSYRAGFFWGFSLGR
jgi:hypothetical protein